MVSRVYVLTLASGSVATDVTVGHNSSLRGDRWNRLLFQGPDNKIDEIELVPKSESLDFKYHESSQRSRDALAAEPNTQIESFEFYTDENGSQWAYYLQTDESNIIEYQFEDHSYTEYNTRAVYPR